MKKSIFYVFCFAVVNLISCTATRKSSVTGKNDGKIEVTFVQVNDVYEIAPLEGGKIGGMARVATLKKEFLKKNPNTFLIMAGDFVSPSVYNSLKYEGKRIRGKQMIEAMNVAGTDLAVFGNHEFDINEDELQDRINESNFKWISSNTFHKTKEGISPFVKVTSSGSEPIPETYIISVKDADGTTVKIGFIGLTIPFNKADYVSYTDPLTAAETMYNRIKDSCDAVVAITHQLVQDDSLLAVKIPGLAMILGGHEHDMRFKKVGNVFITKAHSNARSAYIVDLDINKKDHSIKVIPELKMIDTTVAIDSATNVVVKKWMNIAEENYASIGFDAKKVVMQSGDPLDGREVEIRKGPTNLTKMIVAAMQEAAPDADMVIFNSGSIRVDDIIQAPVLQYDIIRSLPYGGPIVEVDMKGSLLLQTLEAGRNNVGLGGFLQYSPYVLYSPKTGNWTLKNKTIDSAIIYKVALLDFLMTGGEANMGFLTKDNPGVIKVYPMSADTSDPRSDIRLAIVNYLEKKK
jgi:2',3'-cyclic-nucleotide 2'-phosphodiesterase (5'-nucleotidase family)